MNLQKVARYRRMAKWPIIGKLILGKLNIAVLAELQAIEARFGSPTVRFVDQVNDLYDCLKLLELPLAIDPGLFHGFTMGVQTKSSGSISVLLESVFNNEYPNLDKYFTKSGGSSIATFLDWYSSEETLNTFIKRTSSLIEIYCSRNKRKNETRTLTPIKCNESVEILVTSRWLRLLITDLIQVLVTVLLQRTGG